MQRKLAQLADKLDGFLYFDLSAAHQAQLRAYSTDASVYQEKPLAVAIPKTEEDIEKLIAFAGLEGLTLIPRAAGTSLAGQVVGSGIVVDISGYFTKILELNIAEKWVRVQPGVIRDDLNKYLQEFGLMFGPETSTANRAMIGGMAGNNSCGLHSMVWGSVRDHLIEVKAFLSNGRKVTIGPIEDIRQVTEDLHEIYQQIFSLISQPANQELIRTNFPKASVSRRNSGYALDALLAMKPFDAEGKAFNLCQVLAGSEGTLVFITELKINLIELPPPQIALVCIHCQTLREALEANIIALRHRPMASELVDRYIMNFTLQHPEYYKNGFFIEGDPAAILMVEFMAGSLAEADQRAALLIEDLRAHKFGYAWPVLHNNDTRFAWDLRKAGLGLLRNLPGDTQPVNLIEDCAVAPEELPAYIDDLQVILRKYNVNASYYAHAGAGELHVEPMINLKTSEGVKIFRSILAETVELIKKYRGSLSGEHGDGRLRGEYIAAMTGTGTYRLFEEVKNIFDPKGIFNKGKITATPPMDAFLRVQQNLPVEQISTSFDFSAQGGMLALAEKCSGSGDCRKTALSGGTMCPSYMATRAEKDTTRARANLLRQFLSDPQDSAPLTHREIKEVMDLCLSCKGCKIECPSSVDITKMKAEFLHQYQQKHGFSFRSRLIGNFSRQMRIASILPWVYNTVVGTPALRSFTNRLIGFHPKRSMPALAGQSLRNWFKKLPEDHSGKAKVYFFCDEFTNFLDVEIGKKAIMLLRHLGYQVIIPDHVESGRSFLSKGLLNSARNCIRKNLQLLAPLVNQDAPLVGLEPSAILSFRDEYIDLAPAGQKEQARELAKHVFTIEEFISNEIEKGNISSDQFTEQKKEVVMHGHCYQKVLSSQQFTYSILTLPKNYVVQVIPSGCCGMAGSFGYEAEHYEVSQQVGELVLFPALRKQRETTIIAAAGTSCRHQIKDGTGKMALHPVEILWEALKG